jgi:flagellar basal-body rod protein FlgC
MDLVNSINIAASGMRAQSERLRVVSENIANANSVGERPGEDPYRRKVISFKNELDRRNGVDLVKTRKVGFDKSDFIMKYDPAHPAANEEGYVKLPNVNTVIEAMDMREARRSYESNLNVIEASKSMLNQTISLLR